MREPTSREDWREHNLQERAESDRKTGVFVPLALMPAWSEFARIHNEMVRSLTRPSFQMYVPLYPLTHKATP